MKWNRFLGCGLALAGSLLAFPVSLTANDTAWWQAVPAPEEIYPQLGPILESARQVNDRILLSRLDRLSAEEGIRVNQSFLYPAVRASVNFNTSFESRDDLEENPTRANVNFGVSASQPIYHWGALQAGKDIAEIRAQIAAGQFEEAMHAVLNEVRASYLSLVLDRVLMDKNAFDTEVTGQILESRRNDLQAGRLSREEFEIFELNHQEMLEEGRYLRRLTENRLRDFRILVGRDDLTLEQIPQEIPSFHYDGEIFSFLTENSTSIPVQDVTAVQRLQDSLRIQELELFRTNTNLRPKLNFNVGATQDQLAAANTDASVRRLVLFASLNVNWNIFDGFRTDAERQMISIRTRQIRHQLSALQQRRGAEFQNLLDSLDNAHRTLGIEERRVALAEVELRRRETERNDGRLSDLGWRQAQVAYFEKVLARAEARARLLNEWSQLKGFLQIDASSR